MRPLEFASPSPLVLSKCIGFARSKLDRRSVALPETMGPLEAAMLEPLGVAIHTVDLAKPRLLEPVALLGAGPIGLLILRVPKGAGSDDVHVVEPLAHRRAAALCLGAKEVLRPWRTLLAERARAGAGS
jgi:L-iditol 2-dehydrogenase